MSEYQKERLMWLNQHGFCHKCGKEKAAPQKKYCFDCLEMIRAESYKRYNPEYAKKYQARRRKIYAEKKANGICVRCTNTATHGLYCYECSIKVKKYNAEKAQKRKNARHDRGLVPEQRKEKGLCYFCGEPLDGKRKRVSQCCYTCAEKFSKISYRGDKTFFNGWRNAFWNQRKGENRE